RQVGGGRGPGRMASACARTIAGMPTPASTADPAALLMSVRRDRLELMTFLPSKSLMRFELGADVRVRRRPPSPLPTIAAARDGAAFGFTCHKMHVSLKQLRSGDSELAGDD